MKKSYVILIAAIVVAVLVWVIERPDKFDIGDFAPFKLYKALNEKDVAEIKVVHLVSGSTLTRDGEGWKVSELETEISKQLKEKGDEEEGAEEEKLPEFKADTEKIKNIIKKLGELETTSLVSTNPEKQPTYQVGKLAKQVTLLDKSGKVLADLYLGKNGPDMFSTYVRREGENEVYLVDSHIGATIPADVMSWRDKKIWSVEPDQIKEVSVEVVDKKDGESFSFTKAEDGTWHLSQPKDAVLDTAKVEKFVKEIGKMNATRFAFIFDKKETGLDNPKMKLIIDTAEGKKTLLVGNADKQGYIYARLESNGKEIYLLNANFDKTIPSSWEKFTPDTEQKEQ